MKNLHNFKQDISVFFENKFVFFSPGEKLRRAPRTFPKLNRTQVKKADTTYLRAIKRVGRLSKSTFERRLKSKGLKKAAVDAAKRFFARKPEYLALYQGPAKDRKIAKVANFLYAKLKRAPISIQNLGGLRMQAQNDIKAVAQQTAGYTPTFGADMSMTTDKLAGYRKIVSKMNGKVPPNKLKRVIGNTRAITYAGIDKAISSDTRMQTQRIIRKHMLGALNA